MSGTSVGELLGERGRQWVCGLVLSAVAALVIVEPAARRAQESARNLRRIQATYAMKLSWVSNKGVLEQRVEAEETAAAELEAKLMGSAEAPKFAQKLSVVARAAGCAVLSTRPEASRVLPRPEAEGTGGGAKGKATPSADFVEWPVQVSLLGEYNHVRELLTRLRAGKWYLRITRLALRPSADDCESLNCDLELAGYGLRPREKKGS